VLAAWAAGELWIAAIGSAEADYMRTLAAERSQPFVDLARVVTWAGSAYLLVPLAIGCCLALSRAGRPRDALTLAVGLAGGILIANLTKGLTGRARPAVAHLEHVTGSSYPSGHTTQASAFWTSLLLVVLAGGVSRAGERLAVAGTAVIVLAVAWSRVYLGVHHPSDVVAGAALGAGWALFARSVLSGYATRAAPA
jgi:undecaprenyl-diphosphatase